MKIIFGFDRRIWKLLLLSLNFVSIAFLDSFNISSGFPDFHHNFHYYDMCPKSVLFFDWEIFFILFPWSIGDVQWVFNLECFEYETILSALNPELQFFRHNVRRAVNRQPGYRARTRRADTQMLKMHICSIYFQNFRIFVKISHFQISWKNVNIFLKIKM